MFPGACAEPPPPPPMTEAEAEAEATRAGPMENTPPPPSPRAELTVAAISIDDRTPTPISRNLVATIMYNDTFFPIVHFSRCDSFLFHASYVAW